MILIITFYLICVIYCQPSVPTTFIAKTEPIPVSQFFLVYPQVIYNDPAHGQRVDTFLNPNDSVPIKTEIYGNIGTKNILMVYSYNDMRFDTPLCFEFMYQGMGPLQINLAHPFGTGSVNNEPTFTYLDQSNSTWYEVVSNSQYYYPRSFSDIYSSTIFTKFNVEVPNEIVWEIPDCFPLINSTLKLSSPPPVAPFPNEFTYTYNYYTTKQINVSITESVDLMNNRSRVTENLSFSNPTYGKILYDALTVDQTFYVSFAWGGITPTPCIAESNLNPYFNLYGGKYYGTVSLRNQMNIQYFNIYGQYMSGFLDTRYYAFDSTTNDLKAYYNWGTNIPVSNYNPSPDPSIWTIPSKCYQISQTDYNDNNNPGPSLASSFTLKYFGTNEFVFYYNADAQMWRYDTGSSNTIIQKGNMRYLFNSAFYDPSPSIKPTPCKMYPINYPSFPFSFPTNFPTYSGTATYQGKSVDVWSGPNTISYWNSTTPIFFLGTSGPVIITYYQPLPPPPEVFNTPSLCIPLLSKH